MSWPQLKNKNEENNSRAGFKDGMKLMAKVEESTLQVRVSDAVDPRDCMCMALDDADLIKHTEKTYFSLIRD